MCWPIVPFPALSPPRLILASEEPTVKMPADPKFLRTFYALGFPSFAFLAMWYAYSSFKSTFKHHFIF